MTCFTNALSKDAVFVPLEETTPLNLGEEELCGVQLTSSQVADPHRELSTQQTTYFFAEL